MNDFKIYVKGWNKENLTTVSEVLAKYFEECCPKTYFEKGELQCEAECNRSFYDLLSLVSYYVDKDQEELQYELAYFLIQLIIEKKINFIRCGGINKYVFYKRNMHSYGYDHEFTISNEKFESKIREIKGSDGLDLKDIYKLSKKFKNE